MVDKALICASPDILRKYPQFFWKLDSAHIGAGHSGAPPLSIETGGVAKLHRNGLGKPFLGSRNDSYVNPAPVLRARMVCVTSPKGPQVAIPVVSIDDKLRGTLMSGEGERVWST